MRNNKLKCTNDARKIIIYSTYDYLCLNIVFYITVLLCTTQFITELFDVRLSRTFDTRDTDQHNLKV